MPRNYRSWVDFSCQTLSQNSIPTYLRLQENHNSGPTAALYPYLSNLKFNECREVTDAGLGFLAINCPNLQTLDLRAYEKITDQGLAKLTLAKLTSLILDYCKEITDKGLAFLAINSPKLQFLELAYCEKITDQGLAQLVLPQLTNLNLTGPKEDITDLGLFFLMKNCPNLTSLNVSFCKKITDKGLERLSLSKLTSLDLQQCEEVTDVGLGFLARNHPNLRLLNIYDCKKITAKGRAQLFLNLPNIKIWGYW